MRKPFLALLSVLIACVSLSACATFTGQPAAAFTADSGAHVPAVHAVHPTASHMRYGASFGAPLSAPMLPVDCVSATSTACVTTGNPGNGSEGDPAWLAFGKVNAWGTQLGLFANDTANEVLATPDGAAGIPYLRALVGNDIPPISLAGGDVNGGVVGILPVANGGLGLNTLIANDCLAANSAATAFQFVTCGSGGSSAFNAITSGTNTAAAMVVGSGASLTYSGTGSVNASEVAGVIKAVNTAAAGNTLTPNCTYSLNKITATVYEIAAPTQSAPTTSSTGGSLAGNTYYYVVTSETSIGQSTASGQQAITSDTDSPPTNGALTSTSGGTLAATTDYVRSTWVTASGQTTGATETSLAVAADYVLNVAAPSSPPANATGWNVYVSTTTGTETLQNSSPIGTTTAWVEPTTGLVAGSSLPSSNTAWLTATNENVISWAEVTGATGYVVYRSTTPSDFTNATSYTVSGGTTVTFTDTGATGTTATPPTTNTTGAFTIDAPASCTPTDGQKLEIKIISPAGGIVSYDWPSTIIGSTQLALPTTSAGAGLEDYFQLQYDADLTDWVMLSYNQGF